MNRIEKAIHAWADEQVGKASPGFLLRVYEKGQLKADVNWGKTWRYYDLASLTKIFFTVPMAMKAVETKKVALNQDLQNVMPWFPHRGSLKAWLSHRAGNDWWKPFYKSIDSQAERQIRKNQMKALLRTESPGSRKTSVYSDIDFLLTGFLLEHLFETEWLELWQEMAGRIFKGNSLFFHPENRPLHARNLYAPTERCPWRKKVLQGEVHDENTWALGGVAPHAGLFGGIDAVSEWGLWLRNTYRDTDRSWVRSDTLKTFARRAYAPKFGDWALGFMMPTRGSASSGRYFSPKSIGHTGFTGTSFWFDPEQDIFMILLSNRIHPTRKNESFRKIRPQLHNLVMEELGKGSSL